MNHCGRPECECQKRCCSQCFSQQRGQGEYCSCPCHVKPVQEKPSFGASGNDMGYPTRVFGAAPASEAWEEEFDKQFYYHGEYVEEPRERIKSFIRSLLQKQKSEIESKYEDRK